MNKEEIQTFTRWQDPTIEALSRENEKLKEIIYNLTTLTVNGDRTQIKNTAQYKLEQCQQRIDKAIDLLKALDEDTLSNMQLTSEIIGHIEYILRGNDEFKKSN